MKEKLYSSEILDELYKVEDTMISSTKSKNTLLSEESKRLIKAGGKRLRPALLINSAKFGKYDSEKIISLATAIEILHLATLVHDDVIDNSEVRRGVDTIYKKHGNKIAIFTGDFLVTKAFNLVSKYSNEVNTEYLRYLSRIIKNICEGEVEQYVSRYNLNISVIKYLKRIKSKTALLFALSCHVGAEASNCDKKIVKYLRNYGMSLGTAFQIEDDILDFKGKTAKLGKPVANDVKLGIYTLPIIYGLNSLVYGDRLKEILSKKYVVNDIDEIIFIVEQSGGMDYSWKLYNKYLEKANKWLNKLPDNVYSGHLKDLTKKLKSRDI